MNPPWGAHRRAVARLLLSSNKLPEHVRLWSYHRRFYIERGSIERHGGRYGLRPIWRVHGASMAPFMNAPRLKRP